MASAYHMVHYRLFTPPKIDGKSADSLEKLCRVALDTRKATQPLWQRVEDRIYDFPQTPNRKAVLNKVADLSDAIFGELCLVQSDGFQALLELKASNIKTSNITTAEVFNLEERVAPNNSEFIRGMAYWLAIGDHFFFVKTQSMTADNIREYLDWLLKVRSSVLPASASMQLQAEFDRSQVGDDIGEIKSLRVSGNAVSLAVRHAADSKPTSRIINAQTRNRAKKILEKAVMFEQAMPVVRALLGDKKTKSLVDSLGPNEYLTVDASVKVQGRRTEGSRVRMQELAGELADMTEGKVQVEGKDGRLSDDDAILRTKMPFDLPHEGSNFLDFDNVSDQLQEVYKRFVADGKIKA